MSIEEIIAKLEETEGRCGSPGGLLNGTFIRKEYLVEAIKNLKTHPDAQPNEPLTLEDLRDMDGKPAFYLRQSALAGEWVLVSWNNGRPLLARQDGGVAYASVALMFGNLLYRYPPDENIPLSFPKLRG